MTLHTIRQFSVRLLIGVALTWAGLGTVSSLQSPALGQTIWTGASGVDQNWSTADNWDAGVPGSGDTAQFDDTTDGGAAGVVTNVVVDAFGGEVGTLRYTLRPDNENNFFHTTQIAPGTTLLLTTALEVAPDDFNMPAHRTVDVTVTGGAGSGLQVTVERRGTKRLKWLIRSDTRIGK